MTFISGEIGTRNNCTFVLVSQFSHHRFYRKKKHGRTLIKLSWRCSTLIHQRAILLSSRRLDGACILSVLSGRQKRNVRRLNAEIATERAREGNSFTKQFVLSFFSCLFSKHNGIAFSYSLFLFVACYSLFSWVRSEICKAGRVHDSIEW